MNMKKLMVMALAVILLMGVLAGCAASGSGSQGDTSPSVMPSGSEQTDPTATVLVMSEEEKALVTAAVESRYVYRRAFEDGAYRYLGTYNDCIVLFFTDIAYGDVFSWMEEVHVVKDGQVYTVKECYDAGYLTQEQVDQIYGGGNSLLGVG